MTASTQARPTRPGLITTTLTEDFWRQANHGQLLLQECRNCRHRQHYPRNLCTQCWSENLDWITASGQGTVWTFTVVSIPGHPGWVGETPYTIALVQLEEGPRVMTRIVDCPNDEVRVGLNVSLRPTWDEQIQHNLLTFAPA